MRTASEIMHHRLPHNEDVTCMVSLVFSLRRAALRLPSSVPPNISQSVQVPRPSQKSLPVRFKRSVGVFFFVCPLCAFIARCGEACFGDDIIATAPCVRESYDLPTSGFDIVPGIPIILLFETIIPSLGNNTSDKMLSMTE